MLHGGQEREFGKMTYFNFNYLKGLKLKHKSEKGY